MLQNRLNRFNALIILVIVSCIGAYIVADNYPSKRLREKEIHFTSSEAGEVILVWGINGWKKPSQDLLPENSYLKGNVVYTTMNHNGDAFTIKLRLPVGSDLNYCFFLSKDTNQIPSNNWDTNGGENYIWHFERIFRPGYFILLAGVIPLLLAYFKRDKKEGIAAIKLPPTGMITGGYIKQLDSVRALAVILVMVHHWFPEDYFLNIFPNGALGVNVFFVLSGFLITRILLEQKKKAEQKSEPKLSLVGNFIMRRSIRIFPIYYLLLFVLFLLDYPEFRKNAVYYLTYTSNFLFYSEQNFLGYLSHVWSLAVEEQFYLFWPWLMLYIPKKFLPYLIAFFIVLGISFTYIVTEHGWWSVILTPSCFDAFGLGALLSYILVYRNEWLVTYHSVLNAGALVAIVLFVLMLFFPVNIPMRTIHAVMALWLVTYCLFPANNKLLNGILNIRFLMFMGKISYGIYLYHLFIPLLRVTLEESFAAWDIDFLFNRSMPSIIRREWIFLQEWVFVLLLAGLSWVVIEKPINSLKERFT